MNRVRTKCLKVRWLLYEPPVSFKKFKALIKRGYSYEDIEHWYDKCLINKRKNIPLGAKT